MKKYQLTNETVEYQGRTLYRIQALKDFQPNQSGTVRAGELGGWVESERNLPQDGYGWIYPESAVMDSSVCEGVAIGDTVISGHSHIAANNYINNCEIKNSYIDEKAVVAYANIENADIMGNAIVGQIEEFEPYHHYFSYTNGYYKATFTASNRMWYVNEQFVSHEAFSKINPTLAQLVESFGI